MIPKAPAGQYLAFTLKDQAFAFSIAAVREINKIEAVTPIPLAEPYIAGALNLRGKVIPIVDLALSLQLGSTEIGKKTCIVVLDSPGGWIGALVDSVCSVVTLADADIELNPSQDFNRATSPFNGLAKVSGQLLLLCDIKNCFP